MYILITLLSSFNEYILYETYNSVINQKNHNLKYNIIIVVNSLNKNYYEDVLKKFKNIDVEIIETKSNGKPGMGHNSCINLFKNRKEYDYLIPIDGDDYLYPYGLHQIEKLFVYNPDIIVGGNEDVISNFKDLYTENSSIDLNHKYFLNIEPNLLIKKELVLGCKGTPYRLLLVNRKIFMYDIVNYYCENCKIFDDYLFYLHVLNLNYTTNINIYFITLKNIYIYYKAHISSVCFENSHNCDDDLDSLEKQFPLLIELSKKIKLKLETLYVSNVNNDVLSYTYITNEKINYNNDEFLNSEQFKMNLEFNKELSNKIYESTLEFINNKVIDLNNLDIKYKKKLYLILENLILNNIYDKEVVNNFITVSNNLNCINIDIIQTILLNIDINTILKQEFIYYYEKEDYIYCIFKLRNMLLKNSNIEYINSLYYYLNIIYTKLGINSCEILKNNINIKSEKEIIIFLDTMDINYDCNTPYIKGLGGTQLSYIYLGLELSNKYNVIILNKNNKGIMLNNNIHFIHYNDINEMLIYINNINPNIVIYNFIDTGKILKENIKNDILLYMYEHITIYSHFKLKLKQDYYNYYDKLLFVSNNQYNEYIKYVKVDKSKVLINYNGLSPIFYHNNIENVLETKELSIIYISNPQRGLVNFLYIYPLLKQKYKNIKLNIYSSLDMYDIEDNQELVKLYEELKNMEGVTYNKTISQKDLIKELNKTLLFIYPTNMTETFCNAMIEAMSCGCYVISNNIGALKEVADPYGYFIDINIKKNEVPPYQHFMGNDYVKELIIASSNVIDKYLIKCNSLETHLINQINYIKNKYKWNKNILL